ncbi:nucleotidyltransferase substrate binding protein (TIGR01987 family) [Luteibacter sp. Sphag1AF]|uniref:nucleotidyltransferase substrate binding protein n=1 Tax=Luteibacter sp. Sphag1AF TaxID=2587031 RepID=UPI00161E55D2|nr:nucleotidyltransferase substrate binding protein [Luteibacter sp. Sphag1AF]MBB3229162.1 nucleotidyltransferase substrate binding protein (TIGR01987 family) [Luteibacter sp. Sphag1AF]
MSMIEGEGDVIRWEQRLRKFDEVMDWTTNLRAQRTAPASDLERQGWIQVFERCHDLAWLCLRDYLVWQGSPDHHGPRDVIREAVARGILHDGEAWMDLNASRAVALKSHLASVAELLELKILRDYLPLFLRLRADLHTRALDNECH